MPLALKSNRPIHTLAVGPLAPGGSAATLDARVRAQWKSRR